MSDIIAFVFKAGAVVRQQFVIARYVGKGITEDELLAVGNVLLFPWKLPVRDPAAHAVKREIHTAHVERTHFWRESQCSRQPVFGRHIRASTRSDVHHGVGGLFDDR